MGAAPLTPVEQRCREAQNRLPPHARVSRAAAMLAWARGLIGRQIQAEQGTMPGDRLKWEVAMRLYGGDATARAMIQRKLDRVSA
jgi:hypothetical protein